VRVAAKFALTAAYSSAISAGRSRSRSPSHPRP
jgi:hypothetical protein